MASRKAGLNTEIRSLYRQPLEEFTTARNALAARLRKEGRKDDAAEIKALPKPTPSAWAVNALFERQSKKMEALLAAGEQARTAQRQAVSGRGAEALRESIRAARVLSDELRWEAGQILAERGGAPSRATLERIAANLQALAFSPAASEEASRGWLDRDLEPPGFEVLAGLQVAAAPVADLAARREARREEQAEKEPGKERGRKPAPPAGKVLPSPQPSAHEAKRQEARRQLEEAEKVRREREAEKHRRRVAAAEEKLEDARIEEAALREEAARAEKVAAEARRQAEAAEKAAAKAREKAEKAAAGLAKAREDLRGVKEGAVP